MAQAYVGGAVSGTATLNCPYVKQKLSNEDDLQMQQKTTFIIIFIS